MRSLPYIAILTVSLLLLVGCGGEGDQNTIQKSPYVGGTQGLIASFEQIGVQGQSGLDEIYDDETFHIDVLVENKGEFEIPENGMKLTLKGINAADFAEAPGKNIDTIINNDEMIPAADEFLPEGGQIFTSFTSNNPAKYTVTGQFFDANLFATMEYYYETDVAALSVCFKGDYKNLDLCSVEGPKTVYSSGAPIVVRKVEESAAGNGKMFLKFYVENVGGGKAKAMEGDPFNPTFDEVGFSLTTDSPLMTCTSRGSSSVARIVDGFATITCKTEEPLSKEDLFKKQIDLKLKYFYQSTIEYMFRINNGE